MTTVIGSGEVELVQGNGSDAGVARAARVSYGVGPDAAWRGEKDESLIRYLAEHEHLTPFEHNSFTLFVDAPIFVVREWHRHRSFSYNEVSGRFKKLPMKFWYPTEFRIQDPANKQGSLAPETHMGDPAEQWLKDLRFNMDTVYSNAWYVYEKLLAQGVAREIARAVLPLATHTQFYATGNFRNWMHFIDLRTGPDAQPEIREYAFAIQDILREAMPISTDAFLTKIKERHYAPA